MKDQLIIGSGPSAWAVYHALCESKSSEGKVFLIDKSTSFLSSSKSKSKYVGEKSYFGSNHMYARSNRFVNFEGVTNLSQAPGGFSTIWGAGIRLWDQSKIQEILGEVTQFNKMATLLLGKMKYFGSNQMLNLPSDIQIEFTANPPGTNTFSRLINRGSSSDVEVHQTALAVATSGVNACRGCGECLKGCPYGSIFNSGIDFDSLEIIGAVERIHGEVLTLESELKGVKVNYLDHRGTSLSRVFSSVYLCAGPLGTPIILMRSNLISRPVTVKDSQVFYFAGIFKRKDKFKEKRFALSQITISQQDKFSASIYECNEEVRLRFAQLASEKLGGLRISLPKLLDKFLFVGIGFLPSGVSGEIEVRMEAPNKIQISEKIGNDTLREARSSLRKIAKTLRSHRMFILPKIIIPQPGAGFHSGGGLPLNSEYVDSEGLLKGDLRIRISDTSILPDIVAGSHTFTSMVLNASLINKSVL